MANPSFRIAIIGAGQVGGAVAYALILRSCASELLLVDVDLARRDAQVHDLSDVTYSSNSNTRVKAASHHEAGQCDIIVITAGSKYFIGETSILHMYRNVGIIRNVVKAMRPFKRDAVLLIVSNPVDLATQVAQQLSGLPDAQVIGSGTLLDSVRLSQLLADKAGISSKSTEILVLGIQGDSQVAVWSTAIVGGVPIGSSILSNTIDRRKLEQECKDRTKNIVKAKGATPYGVGSIVAKLCFSICFDERVVLPLSHLQHEIGLYFSSPVVLGRNGIVKSIEMPLTTDEKARLEQSTEELKEMIGRMSGDVQD